MPRNVIRALACAALAIVAVAVPSTAAAADDVLYVGNGGSNSLSMLSTAGGTLTPLATPSLPAADVVADNARHRLFVGNADGNSIAVYDIEPDGSLTPVAGSPFAGAAGRLLLSPDGSRLFAGSGGTVSVFTVAANGALTPVAGSPFATAPGNVNGLAVTPDGHFLYASVWTGSGEFSAFSVAPNGALTELAGSPYTAAPYNSGVAVDDAGNHLYLTNNSLGPYDPGDVNVYDIANDGELTAQPGPPVNADAGLGGPTLSPDGTRLYVNNGGPLTISTFTVAPNGSLSGRVDTPPGSGAGRIAISDDGKRLYTTSFCCDSVSAFAVGNDGVPVPVAGSPFPSGGTNPSGLALATPPPEVPPELPAPETTIKGKPKYKQSEDTRFRFSASIAGSTFKCRLDDAAFRGCKSPKNYKHLKPGKHRFEVYAVAPTGVADETPARVKFKVKFKRKRKR